MGQRRDMMNRGWAAAVRVHQPKGANVFVAEGTVGLCREAATHYSPGACRTLAASDFAPSSPLVASEKSRQGPIRSGGTDR
jgi:hypothetical protein